MNSEKRFGIQAQPAETCPMINEVIEKINEALNILNVRSRVDDIDDLRNVCLDAIWELEDLEQTMERIRDRAVDIRAWGQEWKELAKELEEYKGKCEDHERTIEGLCEDITRLEAQI